MSHSSRFLSVLFFIIISCTNNSLKSQKNEITKVSFVRETLPYVAIEIDSSLKYKYFGGENAKNEGYYTGELSEAEWTNLKDLLETVDYNQVDTVNELNKGDVGVELIVLGQNMERHYYGSVVKNDSFYKTYEWLMNSINRIKVKRSPDTLKFESRLRNMPTPIIPKFPPPSLN